MYNYYSVLQTFSFKTFSFKIFKHLTGSPKLSTQTFNFTLQNGFPHSHYSDISAGVFLPFPISFTGLPTRTPHPLSFTRLPTRTPHPLSFTRLPTRTPHPLSFTGLDYRRERRTRSPDYRHDRRTSPDYRHDRRTRSPSPDYRHDRRTRSPSPDYRHDRRAASRSHGPTMVTRTGAVHIPRWAAPFVFGGRELKNFHNLCERNENLVTYVPASENRDWTTFKQPSGQIFAVLILIGYGEATRVDAAMRAIKSGLMSTLRKAKQMKTDGTWRDDRRHDDRR